MAWYCHVCHYRDSSDNSSRCNGTNGPCLHRKCGGCTTWEDINGSQMWCCCRCRATYRVAY